MISSLPGKALRMLVDIARLACVLKAEPGKLDIKIRELGILFISLPIVSIVKIAIMALFILILIPRHKRRHSKSVTSS